jgi:hypothetical protein
MAKWMDTGDWYVNRYRGEVIKDLEDIIRSACGVKRGQAFKHSIPLQQLISYKADANNKSYHWNPKNETELMNEKFQYFAESVEKIVNYIRMKYPFIDMTGIALDWTADQVIDTFMEMYLAIPVKTIPNKDGIN